MVDASVAFGWFAEVAHSEKSVALLDGEFAAGLLAPDLVLVERLYAGWKARKLLGHHPGDPTPVDPHLNGRLDQENGLHRRRRHVLAGLGPWLCRLAERFEGLIRDQGRRIVNHEC